MNYTVRSHGTNEEAQRRLEFSAERYGCDVSFNFDSNGRSVWVMAMFGRGAPPLTLSFFRDGAKAPRLLRRALRDAPMGLLSANGSCPSRRRDTPAPPQDERALRFARDGATAPFETALRDSPSGFLILNGRGDGTPVPQGKRIRC